MHVQLERCVPKPVLSHYPASVEDLNDIEVTSSLSTISIEWKFYRRLGLQHFAYGICKTQRLFHRPQF